MTTKKSIGLDFQWERARSILQYISKDAHNPDIPTTFQAGDVAVCRGSIQEVFYRTLMDLGIPLQREEVQQYRALKRLPFRYCVINRQVTGNAYEVFLLTTFGRAAYHQILDAVARHFAMPMGFTKWPVKLPGIKTKPNSFGQDSSSFLFALTTECEVIPANIAARVPLEELERIRRFSNKKKQTLARSSMAFRDSLETRRAKLQPWAGDGADFALTPENDHSVLLDDDIINYGPFVKTYSSGFRLPKSRGIPIRLGPAGDIRWILRNFRNDITQASKYLPRKPLVQSLLPKPYFAKCLRISPRKLLQLI